MDKNLIVKISNGFGNQMFLYAAAYAFSKKLKYNLLIDNVTGIDGDLKKWKKKQRLLKPKYELGIFNLKSNLAEDNHKFVNLKGYLKKKLLKFLNKFSNKKFFLSEIINNNKKTFYSNFYLSQNYYKNLYLEGYFESENYFKEYKEDLIDEFSFKFNPIKEDNFFKRTIENSNVVSIAFRRNRFSEFKEDATNKVKLKETADFEKLTIEYIYRGIEFFKAKLENPKFLIWSDSFENLNQYFDPTQFIFVENDSKNKAVSDFYLMRQCKYFIVGPTTFHWWAAWLCDNKKKIIICPKDSKLNLSSNLNFWPESWLKI